MVCEVHALLVSIVGNRWAYFWEPHLNCPVGIRVKGQVFSSGMSGASLLLRANGQHRQAEVRIEVAGVAGLVAGTNFLLSSPARA